MRRFERQRGGAIERARGSSRSGRRGSCGGGSSSTADRERLMVDGRARGGGRRSCSSSYAVVERGLLGDLAGTSSRSRRRPDFLGGGGGIANAIVGTIVIVACATVIALPIGILVAVYTSEFAPARVRRFVSFVLDVLNGHAVDRDRHLRLRPDRARAPAERARRRRRARDHHAAARRALDAGGARARARVAARGELRARRQPLAHGRRA